MGKFREINHYHWGNGDDWGSADDDVICDEVGGRICGYARFGSLGQNIGSLEYFAQLATEKRFQEPQTLEKWVSGDRITPLIDLGNIDRVPVTVMVSMTDTTCPPEQAEFLYHQMKNEEKYMHWEKGGHTTYFTKTKKAWVDRMVETIETGSPTSAAISKYSNQFLTFTSSIILLNLLL